MSKRQRSSLFTQRLMGLLGILAVVILGAAFWIIQQRPEASESSSPIAALAGRSQYEGVRGSLEGYTYPYTWNVGDEVRFTLTNTGSQPIIFTSTTPFIIQQTNSSYGTTVYSPEGSSVFEPLNPGGSKTWVWNQRDATGGFAGEGTYTPYVKFLVNDMPSYGWNTLDHITVVKAAEKTNVSVTTSKDEYQEGESVLITVSNPGPGTLLIKDRPFSIEPGNNFGVYHYIAPDLPDTVAISPGNSHTFTWDQSSNTDRPVLEQATVSASVYSVSQSASWGSSTFRVRMPKTQPVATTTPPASAVPSQGGSTQPIPSTSSASSSTSSSAANNDAKESSVTTSAMAKKTSPKQTELYSTAISGLPADTITDAKQFTTLPGASTTLAVQPSNSVRSVTITVAGQSYSAVKEASGRYAATVPAPSVAGDALATIQLHYEDNTSEEIPVTIAVEAKGKITDTAGGVVAGATVTLQKQTASGAYETWNPGSTGQLNPMTTDSTGEYGFIVEAGDYRVIATASDGRSLQSEPIAVRPMNGPFAPNLTLVASATATESTDSSQWLWIVLGGFVVVAGLAALFFRPTSAHTISASNEEPPSPQPPAPPVQY